MLVLTSLCQGALGPCEYRNRPQANESQSMPKRVATRFREEYFEFSKTNKQMNELRKLIQRAREIEHKLLKSQEQS